MVVDMSVDASATRPKLREKMAAKTYEMMKI
jgi:hypothetical protein